MDNSWTLFLFLFQNDKLFFFPVLLFTTLYSSSTDSTSPPSFHSGCASWKPTLWMPLVPLLLLLLPLLLRVVSSDANWHITEPKGEIKTANLFGIQRFRNLFTIFFMKGLCTAWRAIFFFCNREKGLAIWHTFAGKFDTDFWLKVDGNTGCERKGERKPQPEEGGGGEDLGRSEVETDTILFLSFAQISKFITRGKGGRKYYSVQ